MRGFNFLRKGFKFKHNKNFFTNKHLLNLLINTPGKGIILITDEGYGVFANLTLCNMLGYTEKELCNFNFQTLLHPDDCIVYSKDMAGLKAGRLQAFTSIQRIRKHSGDYIFIKGVTTLHHLPGREAGLYVMHVEEIIGQEDLTAIIADNHNLQSRLFLMEKVFELSTDGIFLTNVMDNGKFNIVKINPAFTAMSGVTGEYINLPFDESQDPGDGSIRFIVDKYRQVVETKKTVEFEISYNQNITITRYVPVLGNFGKVEHIIGVSKLITKQREYENTLVKKEQEFRSLVENSEDIITRYDRDLCRIYANPAYFKLTGFTPADTIGANLTIKTPLPSEVAQKLISLLKKVLETGMPSEIDMEWVDQKSKFNCYFLRAVPEFSMNGKVESILTIARNISDRKLTEKQLALREEEFRTLVENSDNLIIRYNKNCQRVYVNPAFLKVSGVNTNHVIGNSSIHNAVLSEAMAIELHNNVIRTLQTGNMCEMEIEQQDSHGINRNFHARLFPEYDKEGNVTSVLLVSNDITEYRKMQNKLQETQSRLSAILATIPDLIWLKDKDGVYLACNKSFEEFFGAPENLIIGKTDYDFVDPELASFFREKDKEAIIAGKVCVNEETVIYASDRRERLLETRKVPVCNASGEITGVLGIARDITDRKKMEETNRQLNADLAATLEAIPDLLFEVDDNGTYHNIWTNQKNFPLIAKEQLIGHTIFEVLPEEAAKIAYSSILETRQKGKSFGKTYSLDLPIGKRWFEISSSRKMNFKNDEERIISIVRDITARKDAELLLAKREQELRTLTQNIPDPIFRYNRDCQRIYVNQTVCRILGCEEADLLNKTPLDGAVVDSDQNQLITRSISDIFIDSKPRKIDVAFIGKDGVQYDFNLFLSPEFGPDGHVESVLGIGRDITERKKIEIALADSERKVRKKLESVLSPNSDFGYLELSDILDVDILQPIIDNFCKMTDVPIGVIDINGKVVIKGNWQDICTKFHRLNPESCKRCVESDIELSKNVKEGAFRKYLCKNNMWDIATPIFIGGKHMGNIFLGQFFYDNEILDVEYFRNQARHFGYNEEEYLAALKKVPRVSHENVEAIISFLSAFASLISNLSYSNLKLANTLEEYKRMENEVRLQSEFKQLLLNGVREIGITIMINDQGKIVFTNDLYQGHILGYEKGEMSEKPDFIDFVHPDDHQKIKDIYHHRMVGEDSPLSYEIGAINKNGQRREYEMSVASIPGTHPKQLMVFAKDITDRVFAIEQLKKKQAVLEEAQRIGRIGSWELDLNSGQMEWTDEVNRILKIYNQGKNTLLETIIDLTHPDDRQMVSNTYIDAIHDKKPYDIEHKLLLADGRIKYISQHGEIYFNKEGIPSKLIGTIRDMTHRKKAELELLRAKEKAEESDRLKSAFLSTMNHELRTPLNHILGFSELLMMEPEKSLEYARIISNSGKHLLSIIEDIFKLSLFHQSEIATCNQEFALTELILENQQTLTETLENSGKSQVIELVFNHDKALRDTFISADLNKINQVLANLFKNAVKFTITGTIEFGIYSHKPQWLTFYVSDTGIGIDVDKQHLIFEHFRQADDTNTRNHGGIGIGLAISRKIAEVLKGTLTFVSEPGIGTTFYFSIPVDIINKIAPHPEPKDIPDLKGKTVMIVEDDPCSRDVMCIYLAMTGADIIEATNGQDAIDKFNPSVDIVLMDMCMPILDGFESTRRIREKAPEVPVIAVTALSLADDKLKALKAGCNSILTKPVHHELLFSEIRCNLPGQSPVLDLV